MHYHLQMSRQSESVDISINFADCYLNAALVFADRDAGRSSVSFNTVRNTFVAENTLIFFVYSDVLIFSGHRIIYIKHGRNINVSLLSCIK
jgi:hypothetical protein